jgi:DNA-binding LytR/AlgR family response regulator
MKETTPVYKDLWFRIIGCLLISEIIDSIGREESLLQRLGSKYFYYDLLGGFIIALLLWEATRFAIIRLDRRFDWLEKPVQRITLQLLFAVFLPAMLSFVFTMIFMKLAYGQNIFETSWLNSEFYTVVLFILFVNVIYFTWWLLLKWKTQGTADGPVKMPVQEYPVIEIARAGKKLLLSQQDIACAFLSNGYCYVKLFSGESFMTSYTLEELARMLDESVFFRANRQTLLNRKSCQSYKSIENGKIELDIHPPLKNAVIVSQKRASEFRKWVVSPLSST